MPALKQKRLSMSQSRRRLAFRIPRLSRRQSIGGLIGTCLAALVGLTLFLFPIGNGFQHLSYDSAFLVRPKSAIPDVVLVYLDEASHKELQQPYNAPWDRELHARLLDRLTADHARAVVFDVVFSDPVESRKAVLSPDLLAQAVQADRQLARAIKANGQVVLGADLAIGNLHETIGGQTITLPADTFRQAAAGYGLVSLTVEPGFAVRQIFTGEDRMPGLAWVTARLLGARLENAAVERWLNYYGPPDSLPCISYYQALYPDGVRPGFFRDKVVFVGSRLTTGFSGQSREAFATPYSLWTGRLSPGVEIHATAFLNLYHGDHLKCWPAWMEVGVLLFAALIFGLGLVLLRPSLAVVSSLAAGLLIGLLAMLSVWQSHHWFSWLIVVAAQLPVALLWAALFNSFHSYLEKRLIEQSLSYYISPQRVKYILQHPSALKPGAELQTISILFSDIANFSKIAGRLLPGDLVKLLNGYFEFALRCVYETDGTVVKLIGDSIFSIWNAPEPQSNHQERACRTALRMRAQLARLDAAQTNTPPLHTRIGLHSGVACVGNFGSSARFDYTAIGDSINLASRLEGLNKHLGTGILVSREILSGIEDRFLTRLIGYFRLKGIDRVIEAYELLAAADEGVTRPAGWEIFARALHHFQRQDFETAESLFKQALALLVDDGPSRFYLELIPRLRQTPPGTEWAGEVDMKSK
jgi:adenylate cyclase